MAAGLACSRAASTILAVSSISSHLAGKHLLKTLDLFGKPIYGFHKRYHRPAGEVLFFENAENPPAFFFALQASFFRLNSHTQ